MAHHVAHLDMNSELIEMGRNEKRSQASLDLVFGEINQEMIESGRSLRRKLNTVSIILIIFLAIFAFYVYF